MNNVYLFTWEEKYLLDKEVTRWKDNFVQKFGHDSVFSFDTENFDAWQIVELLLAGGLFSEKKLVIVSGIPLDTDTNNKLSAKQVEEFSDAFLSRDGNLPDNVLLILVSHKPDKRLKLYKFLQWKAQIKEFKPLSGVQIKLFVKEHLWTLKMSNEVLDYFLMKVGKNLYRLVWEIEKLQLRSGVHKQDTIDQSIIDLVNYGQVEVNSFLFFDYLLPEKEKAIRILDTIHAWWGDVYLTLGMVYRWLKLYIYLIDLYKQGIHDNKTLAQMVKYHPFAVSKAMKHIDKLLQLAPDIKKMFRSLVELDYAMKTWKLPPTAFWLALKKIVYKFNV